LSLSDFAKKAVLIVMTAFVSNIAGNVMRESVRFIITLVFGSAVAGHWGAKLFLFLVELATSIAVAHLGN
jgi:hypothetical protein